MKRLLNTLYVSTEGARDAVDFLQRVEQSRSHFGQPVGAGQFGGGIQAPVDPTDEITTSNVANEQV